MREPASVIQEPLVSSGESLEQHSIPRTIALHILPGMMISLLFIAVLPTVQRMGLPPFVALCVADVPVMVYLLAYLYYKGYEKNGRLSLDGVVLYREPVSFWQYLLWVPVVFLASGLIITLLAPVGNALNHGFFAAYPNFFLQNPDIGNYSRETLIGSYLLFLAVIVLLGPIVEEIYFRGYLLPRISRFGAGAALINTVLFALYHLWTPWLVLGRMLGVLPLILVVRWKRNIYIGMGAHVLANSVDLIVAAIFIFQSF